MFVSWSNSPAKISLNHCILPAAKKYFTTANLTLFLTNKTHEVVFTDAGLNLKKKFKILAFNHGQENSHFK